MREHAMRNTHTHTPLLIQFLFLVLPYKNKFLPFYFFITLFKAFSLFLFNFCIVTVLYKKTTKLLIFIFLMKSQRTLFFIFPMLTFHKFILWNKPFQCCHLSWYCSEWPHCWIIRDRAEYVSLGADCWLAMKHCPCLGGLGVSVLRES